VLDDLMKLDDTVVEILVYDDDSTDNTGRIIELKALSDKRIRYIRGSGPASGWLGKNHACHMMALETTGDYLMFLDADVRVSNELIVDSLSYAISHDLALLSIFPVQLMKSVGEWLTVPLMNQILVGNLPMVLIRKAKWHNIAAANGQVMIFLSEVYKKHWFHEKVKNERVEDIRIIQMMKKMGYKTQALLSDGQVQCRMYMNYHDALNGFSKNLIAFFGYNWVFLSLYLILTTSGLFAVWQLTGLIGALIYLLFLVILRTMISRLSSQNWLRNIISMPLQQATLILLSFLAAWRHMTGRLEWKGRRI